MCSIENSLKYIGTQIMNYQSAQNSENSNLPTDSYARNSILNANELNNNTEKHTL